MALAGSTRNTVLRKVAISKDRIVEVCQSVVRMNYRESVSYSHFRFHNAKKIQIIIMLESVESVSVISGCLAFLTMVGLME